MSSMSVFHTWQLLLHHCCQCVNTYMAHLSVIVTPVSDCHTCQWLPHLLVTDKRVNDCHTCQWLFYTCLWLLDYWWSVIFHCHQHHSSPLSVSFHYCQCVTLLSMFFFIVLSFWNHCQFFYCSQCDYSLLSMSIFTALRFWHCCQCLFYCCQCDNLWRSLLSVFDCCHYDNSLLSVTIHCCQTPKRPRRPNTHGAQKSVVPRLKSLWRPNARGAIRAPVVEP